MPIAHLCPECASPLDQPATAHERALVCPKCGGQLRGLSPFERSLAEGVGAGVWVASSGGSPATPCPYCAVPMRRPDSMPDAPAGMAVCRACQQVWVPASASAWMAAHANRGDGSLGPAPAPLPPSRCENCGAPAEPDPVGRCPYCHAQITAPEPAVVVAMAKPDPAYGYGSGSGSSLLMDLLTRAIG